MRMDYPYKALELTPAIFKELLIELFDGKQFDRSTAVDIVLKHHANNGGKLSKPSYIQTFKKACAYLKDNGLINVGYGVWRLNYEKDDTEIVQTTSKKESISYSVDKEIGSGEKSIYVYYYDSYKKLAESKGQNTWQCKVGRTDVDPISRIIGQAGTCYPELPHVALVIYCDDSALLERTLHSILKMRNKWLTDSPGKEWFMTSPKEIEDIYSTLIDC